MSSEPRTGSVFLGEPWWARAITRWGLGTAIAVYLIYLLAGRVAGGLDTLNQNMATHMQSQETQKELLAAVCSNTAKTEAERNFCLDITMRDQAATQSRSVPSSGS